MTDFGLKGRVALVTGASRNIGRAIALALAEEGASIAIVARSDREAADVVGREVEAKGVSAKVLIGDVADEADAARLVAEAVEALGRLDILVNNAAIRREAPVEELTYKDWRDVIGVTLDGAFLMSRASIPHLRAGGSGAIINIGGLTAYTGALNRVHVVSAKAGLDGMTKALAHELSPQGITVNLVSPGMIDTNREHTMAGDPAHHKTTRTLVGRRGTPEEVAAAVTYLASMQARFTTGQTLHINGGAFLP